MLTSVTEHQIRRIVSLQWENSTNNRLFNSAWFDFKTIQSFTHRKSLFLVVSFAFLNVSYLSNTKRRYCKCSCLILSWKNRMQSYQPVPRTKNYTNQYTIIKLRYSKKWDWNNDNILEEATGTDTSKSKSLYN